MTCWQVRIQRLPTSQPSRLSEAAAAPEEREVVNIAATTSGRRGAVHQGVLGRRAWDAELERDPVAVVFANSDQLGP